MNCLEGDCWIWIGGIIVGLVAGMVPARIARRRNETRNLKMLKPLQEYKCNTYENDHYTAYERGYGDGLSDGEDWGNRVVDLLDAALNDRPQHGQPIRTCR